MGKLTITAIVSGITSQILLLFGVLGAFGKYNLIAYIAMGALVLIFVICLLRMKGSLEED